MTDWLEFDNVHFAYGNRQVLQGINFRLGNATRVLGVVGHSGVGKSTLLNLVAGFLRPQSGKVLFNGQIIAGPSADRPVVFQDHNLFPWMTVLDNISFGLKARGVSRQSRYEIARKLIAETGLNGSDDKFPPELSGGMQQRVGLARALAIAPQCLVLDEPFGSLDDKTKIAVHGLYQRLLTEHKMYAVHVTHDITEAVELCNAIFLLKTPTEGMLLDFASNPAVTSAGWVDRISRELSG